MTDVRARYEEEGYVGPFSALDRNELARLNVLPLINSLSTEPGWQRNRHLDVPTVAEICRCEKVVARVRSLLGPDVLLWRTNIFAVSSRASGFMWHQDEYRTLIDCGNDASQCSVQLNFSDSTKFNCVVVIPGSHRWDADELQRRGYSMLPGSEGGAYGGPMWHVPNDAQSLDVQLKAGQFYIFHPSLLHASIQHRPTSRVARWLRASSIALNRHDPIRYSIALRVATPDARILPAAFVESPSRAACVLLSGTDKAGVNPIGTWAA